MILPSQAARLVPLCLLFVATAVAAGGAPATEAPPAEAPVGPTLVRELVRLDEELELGTYPDGSGLWTSRVAAALEHRLREPSSERLPAAHLMRHLAVQLRDLGVEHDLEPLARADAVPASAERSERLRRLLATVRLLHDKLARLAAPEPEGDRIAARIAPGNDFCTSPFPVTGNPMTGSTAEATNDGSASCGGSDSSPDVWYSFVASEDGPVTFHTFGSSFDTVLALYDRCPDDDGRGIELACNDDAGGTDQSRLTLEMSSGEEVRIRLAGSGGDSGAYELTVGSTVGISGRVTRASNGAALSGVQVGLYTSAGTLRDVIFTESDGSYLFTPLPAGFYYVRTIDAPGLVDEVYDDVACFPLASCDPRDGTAVTVSGSVRTGIDFALDEAGAISGKVTDSVSSDPLDAFVTLYNTDGSFLSSVSSGADASYEFPAVPRGQYVLTAEASMYQAEVYDDLPCTHACSPEDGTRVTVNAGTTTSGVDFALDELGGIAGTVSEDPSGLPLASRRMELYHPSGVRHVITFTTSDGSYLFEGLATETFYVRTDTTTHRNEVYDDVPCPDPCDATTGTPVAVSAGATTSGVDFGLITRGVIAGTVTHSLSGQPLEFALVRAYDLAGSPRASDHTSPLGEYEIEGLQQGDYHVRATLAGHVEELFDDVACLDACDLAAATPVSVVDGITTGGIDFGLDRYGQITGRVTAADNGFALVGTVSVYDEDRNRVGGAFSTGGYTVSGLPAGSYYVQTDLGNAYQDELFPDVPCDPTCDFSAGTLVPVSLNGSAAGIDFVLRPCPADSFVDVFATLYFSSQEIEACERLTASAGTSVQPGADVTFRAGRTVVLGDGFSVQSGGSFRAVLEPEWAED